MSTTNKASDWFLEAADHQPDPEMSVGGLAVRLAAEERNERNPQLAAVGKMIECTWHGRGCKRGSKKRRPKSNSEYWNSKIEGNIERDAKHCRALAALGWRCIVIWDCQTTDTERLRASLCSALAAKTTEPRRDSESAWRK